MDNKNSWEKLYHNKKKYHLRMMDKAEERIEQLSNALKVITLDKKIVAFLKENDPKALEQCLAALRH